MLMLTVGMLRADKRKGAMGRVERRVSNIIEGRTVEV